MCAQEVDAVVTRLFALLGVVAPREGSVLLDFHEGVLHKVRPTPVITLDRKKKLATDPPDVHTRQL